ncbi:hypothetical protein BG015_009195 [Linnemannia schmuckeri]|uniref:Uncharacterized protein n=1 Tax=Linnemannia schmuckeri TaxID=64567 RepID=A0A9P5VA50_9FUNG|nr:hypothetical protein BG015_009195 [Linnemannia schmuckeri]
MISTRVVMECPDLLGRFGGHVTHLHKLWSRRNRCATKSKRDLASNDDDEGYGDPSNSNNNNSTAIEMLHQEQEKRDFKRRSSSPFSIFRSPVPPHLLYKDDSDVAPQADRRNTRPANDDYEEYNNPDQDYNLSQDLPSAAPKDRRIWSHDSATAISIDYDDDDLMDLALDLELHLKLNNGQLDFDEMMRRPDFRTLYDDTNRANFREAVKAFLIISVSSTAAVYLLLLTYKLAEDLYIFVTFEVALTLLRWAWILVAVWPWHLMLWMGLGAYHLFLMVLWPSKDTLAMAFHMSVMYTLRRLRRTMMVKQP